VSPASSPILDVRELSVQFPIHGGILGRRTGAVRAVDGVSFAVRRGKTFGLVGESGCGKTTIGKSIINILEAEIAGQVHFARTDGDAACDLRALTRREMLSYREHIQMVFQDPYSSLNPRLTVQEIVEEPLRVHRPAMLRDERESHVAALLGKVGLRPDQADRYPHEFSGGQRQRIGVARALATSPALIVLDEPVSALDVSIQAQTVNLLQDLQDELALSYVFIAHDLSIVEHMSDDLGVMYLGDLVERGPAREIYKNPAHPYTKALLSAVPRPDPEHKRPQRIILQGDVPSPMAKPSGCPFRTRCWLAEPACAVAKPPLIEVSPGRFAACPIVAKSG